MLQSVSSIFVVYRRKTLTGSPDPTHANGTNKPCTGKEALKVTSRVDVSKDQRVNQVRLANYANELSGK